MIDAGAGLFVASRVIAKRMSNEKICGPSPSEVIISLRKMDLSDLDGFMEWTKDEELVQFCFSDPKRTKESSTDFIKNIVEPHPWYRAICIGNKPIGSISVEPGTGVNGHRAELGYALGVKYWDRGIATLAVKMVVDSIFKEWQKLERLDALVHIENLASQRVLEKADFCREAVFRKYLVFKGKCYDLVMYSILSDEVKNVEEYFNQP
ncbi:hypothetical protein QQ045_013683 [Rhodiola kirilowii]